MFSYLKLKNFKSFKDIKVDFKRKNNTVKNLIFIYGENGVGKSNLAYSFQFLQETMRTLNLQKVLMEVLEKETEIMDNNSKLLELDEFKEYVGKRMLNLSDIVEDAFMIETEDDMEIEYGFIINEVEGFYKLTFDKQIKQEKLYYKVEKNRTVMFDITRDKHELNKNLFYDINYERDIRNSIERYWGKHTLMSILLNELEMNNAEYTKGRINENLLKIIENFMMFSTRCKIGAYGEKGFFGTKHYLLNNIVKGNVPLKDKKQLILLEEVVRYFLTNLYSDIKDVYYKKQRNSDNQEIKYELFIKKLIGGKIRNIKFELESTGTHKLIEILPALYECISGNTAIIDEIDTGIHDLLFSKIIDDVSDSIQGQLISTIHNTTLLENLDKQYVYIILSDNEGNKEIKCVNDYETRTHINHNIRERYLKGMYGGAPLTNMIDFEEMIEILNQQEAT